MTFDVFTTTHAGRANILLLPNGIEKKRDGKTYCAFSLLFGFNVGTPGLEIGSGTEFLNGFFDTLNGSAKDIVLRLSSGEEIKPFGGSVSFFDDAKRNLWRKLVGDFEYVVGIAQDMSSELGGADASAVPFFSDELLDSTHGSDSASMLGGAPTNVPEIKADLERHIDQRQNVYEDVSRKGKADAEMFARRRALGGAAGNRKDILSLFHTLYQHPRMARQYGLIYDFSILINSDPFIATYFNPLPANEKTIALIVDNTKIQSTTKMNNDREEIKDIIKSQTVQRAAVELTKYYHGPADFGFIRMAADDYLWMTTNPDHQLQNRKILIDEYTSANGNEKVLNMSELKKAPLEGIFLMYKEGKNPVQAIPPLDCPWSIIGQTVMVSQKAEANTEATFSLCNRNVEYDLGSNPINHNEEGWIQIGSQMLGSSNSYESNTIFNWTGYNLCVPKIGARPDQRLEHDSAFYAGGMAGIHENDEYNIIAKNGFTYKYKLSDEKDTQLVDHTSYRFAVRHVLSNGYTLKLDSSTETELSVRDIIDGNLMQDDTWWFDFGEFRTDEETINAPTILPKRKLTGAGPKTPESSSHLVLLDNDSTPNTRWIFPPQITFQQAQYFGVFTPEWLAADSLRSFVSKATAIAKRSEYRMQDEFTSVRDVKYLADPRATQLVLSAADWFTQSYFVSRQFAMEDFFNYGRQYSETVAGILRLQADDSPLTCAREIPNTLTLGLRRGFSFRFYLQLQENTPVPFPIGGPLGMDSRLAGGNNNQPKYARTMIIVTHAVSKPAQPLIRRDDPPRVIEVTRPTREDDIAKLFWTFKLINYPDQEASSFLIETSVTTLLDDGSSMPEKKEIDKAVDRWKQDNPEFQLLKNECPPEVFRQKFSYSEKEVFRNRFGFALKISPAMETKLSAGTELVTFEIGNDLTARLVSEGAFNAKLNVDGKVSAAAIDFSSEQSIIFEYDVNQAAEKKLQLKVGAALVEVDTQKLPYTDLSAKHLKLHAGIEADILESGVSKFRFIHTNDYFVYRAEQTAGIMTKKCRVLAISNFPEYFPTRQEGDFRSAPSESVTLYAYNNEILKQPRFSMSPVLMSQLSTHGNQRDHRRSMHVLFEIDRPLREGEYFGIIVAENDAVKASTSAIGRDSTTRGEDFISGGEPLRLTDFLVTDFKNHPFQGEFEKYLHHGRDGNLLFNVDGRYQVLALRPYFDSKKQKWIAILAFNHALLEDRVVHGGVLNAFNPFIKVVAATFVDDEVSRFRLSAPAPPQYMPILTERRVVINQLLVSSQKAWSVTIENFAQRKIDSNNKPASRYVVMVRDNTNNEMVGSIIPCRKPTDPDGKKVPFYEMTSNKIWIERVRNAVLCVYEFETFDNSPEDLEGIELLDHPGLKLLYAETFS